jgi:hypothetical protein
MKQNTTLERSARIALVSRGARASVPVCFYLRFAPERPCRQGCLRSQVPALPGARLTGRITLKFSESSLQKIDAGSR